MRFLGSIASSLWSTVVAVVLGSGLAIAAANFLFGMSLAGAIAFYFVVWWIVLFVTLPLGIRSQAELGVTISGTDPGAPFKPQMRERVLLTTVLADVVFLATAMLLPLAGL